MDVLNKNKQSAKKGIALLLTLTIVMILSLSLSDLFENTAIEVKTLQHNKDQFQADNFARSAFRIMLSNVKKVGVIDFYKYTADFSESCIPIPGEDSFNICNPEIYSLDHNQNINSEFTRGVGLKQTTKVILEIFKNFIEVEGNYLDQNLVYTTIGAISDWADPDSNPADTIKFRGTEQSNYLQEKPAFIVKNEKFDLVSELKIIPSYQKLTAKINVPGSTSTKTKERQKFIPDQLFIATKEVNLVCNGKINIYLLSTKEAKIQSKLENILNYFKNIDTDSDNKVESSCQIAANYSDIISKRIAKKVASIDNDRYKFPLNTNEQWKTDINEFSSSLHEIFEVRSSLIALNFDIRVGDSKNYLTKRVKSHLKLNYKNEEGLKNGLGIEGGKIDKIEVVYFKVD